MRKKQAIYTFFVLVFPAMITAQHNYIPFPDSGAVWVVEHNGKKSGNLYVVEDTVINGVVYKNVDISVFPPLERTPYSAFRNDTLNQRVYMIDFTLIIPKEQLLYDFSLNVGDTVEESYSYQKGWIIVNIDTLFLRGKKHRIYYVEDTANNQTIYPYIEGIGCVTGPFSVPFFFEETNWLNCFTPDGLPYYPDSTNPCELFTVIDQPEKKERGLLISPNPVHTSQIVTVSLKDIHDLIIEARIFNSIGREILLFEFDKPGKVEMDLSGLSTGLHLIRVLTAKKEIYVARLVRN